MTLLRNEQHLIFFAHIPKTGGSSVESALRDAGAKRALHYHKRLGFSRSNLQHMHARLYDKLVPPDFYDYGLTVIRHPFNRLLSENKWRIQLEQAGRDFDPWVVHHLTEYENRPYLLDNHIRPQHEFVSDSVEVFRFEDGLERPLSIAAEKLGLTNVDLGTHRRAGGKVTVEWQESTRSLALDFYAEDFRSFGYDPDDTTSDIVLI